MGKKKFTQYLIPGFLFQSAVIGGGYGTGAEIREYFFNYGFVGGLLGMLVTLVSWSLLCAITFEFTRTFKTYDYKSMMTKLLGKGAFLYEICYLITMFLVLGVMNATIGSMMASLTGLSSWIGIGILVVGTFLLVYKGTEAIEKALSFWSYVLYAVYILFMVICFTKFGSVISEQFALGEIKSGWALSGANYSFYNLGIVPALLYTIRNTQTRKEAIIEGLLSGVIAVVPAALLLVVLAGVPGTLTAEVPVVAVFEQLNMPWLYWLFEIVLMGTLIETATAFIKAMDDRIEHTIEEKGKEVKPWVRPVVTLVLLACGVVISTYGLVGLIAKGYGAANWGFFAVYVIPILTIGIYKISKANK